MIPTNKKLTVLHPYLNKKWWAANMMIYLSNFLSINNSVNLYTFSYDKNLFPSNENKFLINCFNNSKLFSFFKIAYVIRNSDYIFIWNSPMHFVWVISKTLFRSKAKLIWWHHHFPWYYSPNTNVYIKLKKILEKYFIKSIDLIIVNSKYLQGEIKDIYKIDSKILYPVLDNKFLNYKWIKSFSTNTIFTYGRWVNGKNLEMIFNTYDNLKDKIPNLVLKIWWDWNQLDKFKDIYKDNKNIIFLWIVDKTQIIKTLEKSSLFLFPSKVDSFWLVILESMSIWVPVISYNISWAKEIIKNWVNWYLVNSDNEFISKSFDILFDHELEENLSIESLKTSISFWEQTFKKQLSEIF